MRKIYLKNGQPTWGSYWEEGKQQWGGFNDEDRAARNCKLWVWLKPKKRNYGRWYFRDNTDSPRCYFNSTFKIVYTILGVWYRPKYQELHAQLFANSVWVLLSLTKLWTLKGCETGPAVYRPYPRRLESLSICRCHYKGSTLSSVIWDPKCWPGFWTRELSHNISSRYKGREEEKPWERGWASLTRLAKIGACANTK